MQHSVHSCLRFWLITKKGDVKKYLRLKKTYSFSFAGIIRIRFKGYNLSLKGTPKVGAKLKRIIGNTNTISRKAGTCIQPSEKIEFGKNYS